MKGLYGQVGKIKGVTLNGNLFEDQQQWGAIIAPLGLKRSVQGIGLQNSLRAVAVEARSPKASCF